MWEINTMMKNLSFAADVSENIQIELYGDSIRCDWIAYVEPLSFY